MDEYQLGLPEFAVISVAESMDGRALKFVVEASKPPNHCLKCAVVGIPYIHGSRISLIKDLPIADKHVVLEVKVNRYKCRDCGQTFVESFGCIDGQMTARMRLRIAERVLRRDTFTKIATDYSVSDKTVRRIFDDWAAAHAYMLRYETPRILGIDEAHIDDEFRLILTDIENKMPLDMLPNNKYATVVKYFKALPNKNRVEAVTMDFFEGYAKAVYKSFPFPPLVIIDRFHVIQLLNRHMDTIRKRVHAEEKKNNIGKAKMLKNERKIFMANMEDLNDDTLTRLSEWFKEYPVLEEVYYLKETFRAIYNCAGRADAEIAFDKWCGSVPSHLPEYVSLVTTFTERKEHILNWYDKKYTNAFTESVNNITKDIEKRGRGYNFEVLRMIVLLSFRVPKLEKFDAKTAEFKEKRRSKGSREPKRETWEDIELLMAIPAKEWHKIDKRYPKIRLEGEED
jgi:transposase